MSQDYADEDLLGEADDDILAGRAGTAASTGSSPRTTGRLWGWVGIAVAVLVGVTLGSWLANVGRNAPATTGTSAPTASSVPSSTVDPRQRIAELRAAIAANPDDADARLELGVLLYSEEPADLAGARDQWLAVTQLDPTNENAWYNLGFYYLALDVPDCTSAQAAWNTVISLDPTGDNANQIMSHMAGLMPQVCPGNAASPSDLTPAPAPASTPGG